MSQSNDPVTKHHIHKPPNPQPCHCKKASKLGNTYLLSPKQSRRFKKDHNILFGNEIGAIVFGMHNYKLEPLCLKCTTSNIYIHKSSVLLIYMIKYSSLQLLRKPFVCWIGTTSTQRKEYTRSPKPHS